jgi:hypothetical protein
MTVPIALASAAAWPLVVRAQQGDRVCAAKPADLGRMKMVAVLPARSYNAAAAIHLDGYSPAEKLAQFYRR